jgi:hypothetical protein
MEVVEPDVPHGVCPERGLSVALLAADDLRAHLHPTTGEFCPGPRGAPAE